MFFAHTGKGGITDRTFRLSDWWIEMEHKSREASIVRLQYE